MILLITDFSPGSSLLIPPWISSEDSFQYYMILPFITSRVTLSEFTTSVTLSNYIEVFLDVSVVNLHLSELGQCVLDKEGRSDWDPERCLLQQHKDNGTSGAFLSQHLIWLQGAYKMHIAGREQSIKKPPYNTRKATSKCGARKILRSPCTLLVKQFEACKILNKESVRVVKSKVSM